MNEILSNDGGKTVIVDTELNESDIVFYNTKRDPFKVYGLYKYRSQEISRRLPPDVAASVSKKIELLSEQAAGARLRFSTDSPYVAIKAVMPYVNRFSHMPMTGTSGFDLYVDSMGESRFVKCFKPSVDAEGGYEGIVKFGSRKKRYITINFPSHNAVNDLYIGVSEDSRIGLGEFYLSKLPIVYYGSSITQGACSSRPGMIYENIIARRLNFDYMNLGFSGNAKGDSAIVNYMSTLNMLAFVSDYDHNAPNAEHLLNTHKKMYEKIRSTHPYIPYIIVSKPDFASEPKEAAIRRDIIMDTYRYARENGDNNAYFVDGEGIYRGQDVDNCSVDGIHPNDYGMIRIAGAIGNVLDRALRSNSPFSEE